MSKVKIPPKEDVWIGIDPGRTTGVGIWNRREKKFLKVAGGSFWEVFRMLNQVLAEAEKGGLTVRLRIEDSRKDNAIYRSKQRYRQLLKKLGHESALGAACRMGRDVGKVDRDVSLWVAWAANRGIPVDLVAPSSRKKGIDLKLPADRFKKLTGWEGRTNEHGRDGAMLVFKK